MIKGGTKRCFVKFYNADCEQEIHEISTNYKQVKISKYKNGKSEVMLFYKHGRLSKIYIHYPSGNKELEISYQNVDNGKLIAITRYNDDRINSPVETMKVNE